jgi:hypothetical protein
MGAEVDWGSLHHSRGGKRPWPWTAPRRGEDFETLFLSCFMANSTVFSLSGSHEADRKARPFAERTAASTLGVRG